MWPLLLAATATAAPSSGETPEQLRITRGDVIARAIEQNPQVAAERAELVRARARQGRVQAARFPELSITTAIATGLQADLEEPPEHGVNSTRSAYDFSLTRDLSATFAVQAQLLQPLYTFGKIGLRQEATDAALDATRAQVAMKAADIALEAAKLYEAHVFARSVLLFLEDTESFAQRSLEDTEVRLEEGDPEIKVQDKLRLQTAVSLAKSGQAQARAGVSQSLEGLRAYLGIPDQTEIIPADDFIEPIASTPGPLERLVQRALEDRPEIQALENGIVAFNRLADAEYADYYPDIFLMGLVSAAYTPGRDWVTSRFVLDPMGHFLPVALIGARWTLQWDSASHRADEVRADAFRMTSLLAWAKAGLPAEVNRAYQDVVHRRTALEELEKALPLTKQWTVRASADYGAGLGTSRDITDAAEAYVLVKLGVLDAVYNMNVALAELAKATGALTTGVSELYPGQRGTRP